MELTLVSVAEYLATAYRPDRELVDGLLQERNVGEWIIAGCKQRFCECC